MLLIGAPWPWDTAYRYTIRNCVSANLMTLSQYWGRLSPRANHSSNPISDSGVSQTICVKISSSTRRRWTKSSPDIFIIVGPFYEMPTPRISVSRVGGEQVSEQRCAHDQGPTGTPQKNGPKAGHPEGSGDCNRSLPQNADDARVRSAPE